MVDFIKASPLKYALTVKPTVYVSHIRQFLSTARIETTEEGTKILATVDGIHRTVTESSLMRNLKLNDKDEISSLPDTELFENLTLMGYNISPNQNFTFQKGSGTPTEPHHTPSPEAQPTSHTTHSSSTLPPVTTTFIPTVTPSDTAPIRQYTRRARIAQSSALPPVADEPESPLRAPRVTSPTATESSMQQTINELTALVKHLEDKQGVVAQGTKDVAPIKGRNLDEGEAAAERTSDDTEEMETVLTSMDAATVLASEAAEVPTGSDMVPTVSPVFATATVIDAQVARELEEQLEREDQRRSEQIARDAEIARIHVKEELKIMIDGLDRNNETVAKYLQEYHQFALELPIERIIELITDLVKYQDNYAKIYKFQSQQRKPWTKKQKRDYYMVVIRSNLGWKVKDFRGMTFEEVEAKFNLVWKQMEDFIPMSSKEEAERIKRKEKVKEMMQLVPIEEVYVDALQVKHPIIDWKVHTEGQRRYWKITRLGGSSASYQFFIDLLKHLDREDLNQL
nr:hypothetical protein [Tanacetum cinerariifolium]